MMNTHGIDQWAWTQEIARRCGKMGVGFRVDPTCKGPMTDGKTIIMPPLPMHATADDYMIHRGGVIHECGHVIRPQAFDIAKRERLRTGSPLWGCMNIVEDAAQERAQANAYRGDRATLAAMHAAITRRQTDHMAKMEAGEAADKEEFRRLSAAMCTSLVSAFDWSRDMIASQEQYLRGIDRICPGVADLVGNLCKEGWPDRIRVAGDPEGAWLVARDLYARLFPETPEDDKTNKLQPGEGSERGEGEEQKTGAAKAEADGVEPGDGKKGKLAKGVIPWELLMHSNHAEEMGEACPSSIDWTGKPVDTASGGYYTEQTVEKVKPTGGATHAAGRMRFPSELVQQVRILLQSMNRTRWAHEKLEGRLDKRNLTRVIMPRVGDGTFNRQVFMRQSETLSLDCAVTVLVDCSGSMSGSKILAASEAATALFDLCGIALRVPCEVLGFTTARDGRSLPLYFEFKTFAEARLPRETVASRLLTIAASGSRRLCGNADGDAVMFAVSRLATRRESRRILIVLSDGCPADSVGAVDADRVLMHAIKTARATPGVEVYGIGIEDRNVRRYYSKQAPVLWDASELAPALLGVLRDVLQRKAPTA